MVCRQDNGIVWANVSVSRDVPRKLFFLACILDGSRLEVSGDRHNIRNCRVSSTHLLNRMTEELKLIQVLRIELCVSDVKLLPWKA